MGIRKLIVTALVAMILAVPATLAAQQNARDDENLIRGLLRDRLYKVAADKIFDFVFKYPRHPQRESMLYDICDKLLEQGNEAKAGPLLRCYLQEFPQGRNRRQITMMLARSEVATGQYPQAIELLRLIVNDNSFGASDQAAARVMLAELYLSQQRFDGVVGLLESISTRRIGAGGRLALARAYKASGRFNEAEETLRELLRGSGRGETWKWARAELSWLYVEVSRYQDCLSLLEGWSPPEDTELSELSRKLLLAKAISHYHLGDYENAYNTLAPLDVSEGPQAAGGSGSQLQIISILLALNEWRPASELIAPQFTSIQDTLLRERLGEQFVDTLVKSARQEEAIRILRELANSSGEPDRKAALLSRAAALAETSSLKLELIDEAITSAQSQSLLTGLLFARADALEHAGRLDEAKSTLERIIELYEKGNGAAPEAHVRIGNLLLLQGLLEEAKGSFEQAAASPTPPEIRRIALACVIHCHIRQRNWRNVLEVFSVLRSFTSDDEISAECWRNVATAASLSGLHDIASEATQQAILSASDPAQGQLEGLFLILAAESYRAGQVELAESVYRWLMENGGEEIRLAAGPGYILCAVGTERWQDAVGRCRAVAEAAGDSWVAAWARHTLASSLGELGEVEDKTQTLLNLVRDFPDSAFADVAVEELKQLAMDSGMQAAALLYDPRFSALNPEKQYEADRLLLRAQKLVMAGSFEQASGLYRAYPRLLLLPPLHRFLCARAFHRTGNYSDALKLMMSLSAGDLTAPQRLERDLVTAESLVAEGKPDGALSLYRDLLNKILPGPMRLDVLYGAARASEAAGRWAEAQSFYNDYLEYSKASEPALVRIEGVAEAFAAHGEHAEAAKLYRRLKLLAKDSDSLASYSFNAALMLENGGNLESAAEEYLKIAYQNPDLELWPARCRLRAAAVYERLEHFEAAERQYRVVAERFPGSEEGRVAAERLRALGARREAVTEEQIKPPPS
ncbi:MAG TPA: tetratricopeptide repeat protein [Acidobacteriota bacterium]|nr:tetratricopeptide repeat protein [Acidobacteriota bacterium]